MYSFVEYKKEYLQSCAELVKNTWNLHYRFKDIECKKYVYIAYILSCLDYSDYSQLIVDDNNDVQGIILASNENRTFIMSLILLVKQLKTKLWLIVNLVIGNFGLFKPALKSMAISKEINSLGEEYSKLFDSEVNLFIVSKKIRGKQFGYRLMNNYLKYCDSNNISSIFLWTDLSCTYSFYDKYGFQLYSTFYHKNLTRSETKNYNGMIYCLYLNNK